MPILPPLTQHTRPGSGGPPASLMLIVSPMCGIKDKMTIAPERETFATGTVSLRPRICRIAVSDAASSRGSLRWSHSRLTARGTIEPSRYLLAIVPHFGEAINRIGLKIRSFPRLSAASGPGRLAVAVQHVYHARRAREPGTDGRTRARPT